MVDLSRRDFINTTVGLGYAIATLPIALSAISTPFKDLQVADIMIPVGKETISGYVARPLQKGTFPCVIVIHEIFGVHEYIKDICRRLALEGYFAIAPNLYHRYGDATKMTDFKKILDEIVSKTSQDEIFKDLDATYAWLENEKSANMKRSFITGFCWGGNVTWMYASKNPKLKAGVAWYGRLQGDRTPSQPKFPIDIAKDLSVPVLGLYGKKDQSISEADIASMLTELKKGKSHSDILVYPEAGHGFHADYRAGMYHEASAKDGWKKMLEWFARS